MLTLAIAELLGREECGVESEEDRLLLRLLVPVTKLHTAKQVRHFLVNLVYLSVTSVGIDVYDLDKKL